MIPSEMTTAQSRATALIATYVSGFASQVMGAPKPYSEFNIAYRQFSMATTEPERALELPQTGVEMAVPLAQAFISWLSYLCPPDTLHSSLVIVWRVTPSFSVQEPNPALNVAGGALKLRARLHVMTLELYNAMYRIKPLSKIAESATFVSPDYEATKKELADRGGGDLVTFIPAKIGIDSFMSRGPSYYFGWARGEPCPMCLRKHEEH